MGSHAARKFLAYVMMLWALVNLRVYVYEKARARHIKSCVSVNITDIWVGGPKKVSINYITHIHVGICACGEHVSSHSTSPSQPLYAFRLRYFQLDLGDHLKCKHISGNNSRPEYLARYTDSDS
jgi:hypothetical protein